MGNIWSSNSAPVDKEAVCKSLDQYTKSELIAHIKIIKSKKINMCDDDNDKMKSIELENYTLLPMTIELYHKLLEIYGEYVSPENEDAPKNKFSKRVFFIRPKFSIDDIIKQNMPIIKEEIALMEDLVVIPDYVSPMAGDEINLDEYNKSLNDAPIKKDMLGISKKILKYIPVYLKMRIINAYNEILKNPDTVPSFAKGFYMYKLAKNGPTTDINSFRQILALPNIINQLHRILYIRLSDYMIANKYIDTNIQKGCIANQKYSIFEQFFKIKTVLSDANSNGKKCTILFLDITNAFGNVNLEKLYRILELYHVDATFISYLKAFYHNLEYYVDAGSIVSESFKWSDGLIQGCSMSPLLFIIAMNYILVHLDTNFKEDHGYEITPGNKILITAYVDDICICCSSAKSAEFVFNKFRDLCEMLGLSVSKAKSASMVVNDNEIPPNDNFPPQVSVYKYLGEHLSQDGNSIMFIKQFITQLVIRLKRLDKSLNDNAEKISQYEKFIVPWIQKKTLLMYDLGMANRLKIISIIKSYMKAWGNSEPSDLFCNIATILHSSSDNVIKGIISDNKDFDDNLEDEVDIANYIATNEKVVFKYDDIDDELESEFEHMYQLAD